MRKAKETWIEEQCQGIKETCRKTTARKHTSLWKNWQVWNKGELWPSRTKQGNVSQKNKISWTELFWIVYTHNRRSQGARCPSTNQQWQLPYPAGSWSWSKITEERQVGRSGQHSIRVGPGRRRGHGIICNKIWQMGERPTPWTQSLIITLPKKVNLQLCQLPYIQPAQSSK